ncbi:MAG: hypothetical protein OXI87_10955 [Albidovulum sp.]|nr:hypothetical protein [Albidovulum sp.]MDE0305381.1 hypothetical protein [Albidovulum sp.]
MERAILSLLQLDDRTLFETLPEGIMFIVNNATDLEAAARRLHQDEEFRASEIMRGLTEEEAAKILSGFMPWHVHIRTLQLSGNFPNSSNRNAGPGILTDPTALIGYSGTP